MEAESTRARSSVSEAATRTCTFRFTDNDARLTARQQRQERWPELLQVGTAQFQLTSDGP
jgi:hypothetical protein